MQRTSGEGGARDRLLGQESRRPRTGWCVHFLPRPPGEGELGTRTAPFHQASPCLGKPWSHLFHTGHRRARSCAEFWGGGDHLAWGGGEQMCLEDGAVSFSALAAKSCTVKQHRDPVSAAQTPLPLERSLRASLRVPCSNLLVGGCLLRGPWPNGSACSARLPLPNPATSLL